MTQKAIKIVYRTCPNCKGMGWVSDFNHSVCNYCCGKGIIEKKNV